MTAKSSGGDEPENVVIQAYKARKKAKDMDEKYIQQAIFGSPTAATAAGDQAKAALKDEETIKRKSSKHRK